MKRICLAVMCLVLCLLLTGCTGLVRIEGSSMEPTLMDGHIALAAPYSTVDEIQRFDVVLCHFPGRGELLFSKRIVGLPGDRVALQDGFLYVNGVRCEESYVSSGNRPRDFAEVTVPEGCCFVMGDNRRSSHDSRSSNVGPLPLDSIISEIVLVILPDMHPIQ